MRTFKSSDGTIQTPFAQGSIAADASINEVVTIYCLHLSVTTTKQKF